MAWGPCSPGVLTNSGTLVLLPHGLPPAGLPPLLAMCSQSESSDESGYDSDDYDGDKSTVGRPLLLSLGSISPNGGAAAERAVLEKVIAALAPLRKEGAPPAQASPLARALVRAERPTNHALVVWLPSQPSGHACRFKLAGPGRARQSCCAFVVLLM